jgi:hypothetical protein
VQWAGSSGLDKARALVRTGSCQRTATLLDDHGGGIGKGHPRLARSASRWKSPGKEKAGGGSETQEAVEDGRGRTKEKGRNECL